ncbi:hypothetical protein DHEL01_v204814 [Diaporthe helianthi]|uniref:Glucose-methanol-choline oxidoreductase N-terminal domain-containing protein n=1 Tax=Diaporthe helianthi TaxID=158607 RepID=A0A2P5I2T4_DIAHE|nr:hypothetical protein DHEL01_v204814 [Diaporthe helianthi]
MFTVVGGGTAGLAVAARLAPHFSVAVIEAGGSYQADTGNQSVVPYYGLTMPVLGTDSATYQSEPLIDWDLISTPQEGAAGRAIHYARGKTLGGSSALNTLAYVRGSKGTHDRWAEEVDDESYRWDSVLPFFKAGCQLTPPDLEKRNAPDAMPSWDPDAFDGTSEIGAEQRPLRVSFGNWVDPTTSWLARGLQGIGMAPAPKGLNSGSINGVGGWTSSTIDPRDATRSSSQTSYLELAEQITGIKVHSRTQASQILFAAQKATGVTVETQGSAYTLQARKEVVLSGGVFHSPQLLMVSGIGPRATLQSLGIPVIKDLPGVGQNLWEQMTFSVLQGMSTPTASTFVDSPTLSVREATLEQYRDEQAGPYSQAGGYFSFEKIPESLRANFSQETKDKLTAFPDDWPETQYIPFGFAITSGNTSQTVGAMSATLTAPLSRGNVTITSASIKDPPVFDLAWLSDPADGEVAVAALKRCREARADPSLDAVRVGSEVAPGAGVTTDEDILAYIRQSASTVWHASGTCKMGKGQDPMAVVDSRARVFGVEGLRVVDASAFPFAVPTNPQATVYMLAEKIADSILKGL